MVSDQLRHVMEAHTHVRAAARATSPDPLTAVLAAVVLAAVVLAAVVVPAAMPGVVRSHVTLVRPVGGVGRRRVAVRLVSAVWRVGAGSGRVPELRVAAAVSVLLPVSAVPVLVAVPVSLLHMPAAVPVLVAAVPVLRMPAVPGLVALSMPVVSLLVALYMAAAVAVPLAVR